MIAIGLVGSAWLAYAAAGPTATAYPVTKIKVKAKGTFQAAQPTGCTTPPPGKKAKCGKFTASVQRKTDGTLKGSIKVKDAQTKTNYSAKHILQLVCSNQSSAHVIADQGKASGKANKGKTYLINAEITETSPTTGSVSVDVLETPSNTVVFHYSGALDKAKYDLDCP
jgi:hypothetical protein